LPPSSRTLSPFVVPAAVTTQLHPLSLHDALPISAPPPAPSAQHPPHGQSAQGSPLVPQIGSSADGASAGDSTVGSSQADGSPQHDGAGNAGPTAGGANPYGPAGARYASETPPPASGLATGAIPRVH